jgi:hypothetical protein
MDTNKYKLIMDKQSLPVDPISIQHLNAFDYQPSTSGDEMGNSSSVVSGTTFNQLNNSLKIAKRKQNKQNQSQSSLAGNSQ